METVKNPVKIATKLLQKKKKRVNFSTCVFTYLVGAFCSLKTCDKLLNFDSSLLLSFLLYVHTIESKIDRYSLHDIFIISVHTAMCILQAYAHFKDISVGSFEHSFKELNVWLSNPLWVCVLVPYVFRLLPWVIHDFDEKAYKPNTRKKTISWIAIIF